VRHRLYRLDDGDTASRGYLRAVHCLALEPESFERDFAVMPEGKDRGNIKRARIRLQSTDPLPFDLQPTDAALLMVRNGWEVDAFEVDDRSRNTKALKQRKANALPGEHVIKSKHFEAALEEVEWLEWVHALFDRTPLSATDYTKAQAVADAVRSNPTVAALLARPDAMPEQVLEWAEPAVGLARGRADLLTGVGLLDLKKWGSLDPVAVRRDIVRQCVDAQLAWYSRGAEALLGLEPGTLRRGVIVATDGGTDGCPEARVYWLDETLCATGDARLDRALELYAECERSGHWPTAEEMAGEAAEVGAPAYLLRELGLHDYLDDDSGGFEPVVTRLD